VFCRRMWRVLFLILEIFARWCIDGVSYVRSQSFGEAVEEVCEEVFDEEGRDREYEIESEGVYKSFKGGKDS